MISIDALRQDVYCQTLASLVASRGLTLVGNEYALGADIPASRIEIRRLARLAHRVAMLAEYHIPAVGAIQPASAASDELP